MSSWTASLLETRLTHTFFFFFSFLFLPSHTRKKSENVEKDFKAGPRKIKLALICHYIDNESYFPCLDHTFLIPMISSGLRCIFTLGSIYHIFNVFWKTIKWLKDNPSKIIRFGVSGEKHIPSFIYCRMIVIPQNWIA